MKSPTSLLYRISTGVLLYVLFASCQKGDPLEFDQYFKLNLEAFYEDTSLYTTASFNDSVLVKDASVKNGGELYPFLVGPAELPRAAGDSGRLRITIVKKNNSNIEVDSIVHVTNINELLLIQLDPSQRPLLIDKRSVSKGLTPPADDSIKARFYFTSADPNIRNHNYSPASTVTKVDLELWALKDVNGNLEPVNLKKKIRLNANRLSNEYYSFKRGEQYAWRILDVSPGVASNKRVVESFEYSPDFQGFTRGFIELNDQVSFQTIKITQTYDIYLFQPGVNGRYLFGFD